MEKEIKTKQVKMEAAKDAPFNKKVQEPNQKLTYEQLNQACAEMSQQLQNQNAYIQKMHQQMQEMNFALQTKRMDYLFKVVELKDRFSSDFVIMCTDEIEQSLTIPEEQKKTEEN